MSRQSKIIFFAVCLMSLMSISTAKAQTLVLHLANGKTTEVELYVQPQVKFLNDKVLITSSVLDMEYAKEEVLAFTYKGNALGISGPSVNADYTQEDGQLVFRGIEPTDKLAVYAVNGIRIPANFQYSGTTASLSLTAIPSGVYVLSINGQTSKFTKR